MASTSFLRVLESLGLDSATAKQAVEATFIPVRSGKPEGDPNLDSLPQLTLGGGGEATAPELAMEGLLGEGGRGEVRLARQLSLRRKVAVKSLKEADSPELTLELLREARITGNLEHPGIVPVYALGRDAQGRVLLVMKKVDGEPWGKRLRARGPGFQMEEVEGQLEIFRQVCNAIEFAHSQGIVHRDLKPDNVMVGAFGEVVVLDWGLAVSLEGDAARNLPAVSELHGLAGTPAYMAPELVAGEGALIGRWTDVYLLGAILHEILVGAPPHGSGTLEEVLARAHAAEPPVFSPEIPAELAEVCGRALARAPAQRFGSVAALREAVSAFGRHRQSALLAEEAQRRIEGLCGLGPSSSAEEVTQAHAALAQARFGFEQALSTWPESPLAREGLQASARGLLRLELALENLAGAERALAELPVADAELEAQVEALRARQAAQAREVERLKAMGRELDPETTSRIRNGMLALLGVVWFVLPLVGGLMERAGALEIDAAFVLRSWVLYATSVIIGVWVARRSLLKNRIGKRIIAALGLAVLGAGIVRLSFVLLHYPPRESLAMEGVVYGLTLGMTAAFVDVRFAWAAAIYLLAALGIAFAPSLALFFMAGANLFALVPTALFWRRFACFGAEEMGGTGSAAG